MMTPGEPLRYEAINTAVSGPGEHFARYDALREKGNVHLATVNGRNPFLLVSGIAEIRARVHEVINEILDDVAGRGECDYVADVALRFPNTHQPRADLVD